VELHPEAAAAVSLLGEDPRALLPTPTVVARLLRGVLDVPYPDALAAAIGGGGAGRLGLVEVVEPVAGTPHTHHGLRLARAELVALLGDPAALGVQRGAVSASHDPAGPPAVDPELVRRGAALYEHRGGVVVRGPRRSGRLLACDIAAELGSGLDIVAVEGDGVRPHELGRTAGRIVAADLHPVLAATAAPLSLLGPAPGPLLVLVDAATDAGEHAAVDVGPIGFPEATRVWTEVVGADAAPDLAERYRVNTEEARGARREALALVAPARRRDAAGVLARAAVAGRVRAQGARRLGAHVGVVETSTRLDDLVVTPQLRAQLDEIVAWQRGSAHVRWRMGVGATDPTGMGLTCLLAGKPGTGKTFAARCLAGELGLNLYRIDLSQVVSKYIGETEKALATVFDEVEAGHGVLLFDEADAIFGRRSEVKDAHDRYANIEVGYLLQRLETYEGMVVLTTNLQGNMDGAFVRRLRFLRQFADPDRELRRRLWERSLPGPPWRDDDIDLGALADRFPLNGGAIRNIGLAAAHLGAATGSGRITAAHVLRATQRELQKTGRPSDAAAFGPLAADLVTTNGGPR
jgi:hypothetical protein